MNQRLIERWRPALIAVTLAMATPAALPATAQPAAATRPKWTVESHPDADTWFHALAVIGFEGFGPLHMYDSSYAAAVRTDKRRRGVYPTLLDRRAEYLKAEFERDSVFEIMHFLPLYFLQRKGELTDIMEEVARATTLPVPAARRHRASSGLTTISGVFATARQRTILREFMEALADERLVFYQDFARSTSNGSRGSVASLAGFWNDDAVPRLAPFLDIVRTRSAVLVVSPALGADGRSVRLGSGAQAVTVIAVGMPGPLDRNRLIASSVVRELCFPIVHRVLDADALDRTAADRLSSVAAVRCGSHAIKRFMPSLDAAYRTRFLGDIGADSGGGAEAAFIAAFPVSSEVNRAIERALASH